MKVLVTGGAGYIGSFMIKKLLDDDYSVTVIDNLERGHVELVDERAQFFKLDIKDDKSLSNLFSENSFDAVFHFAGLISVEESEKEKEKYFETNTEGSKKLFTKALEMGKVKKFIFSSTAAVYGNPTKVPIPEDHPKNPTSVYGKTKLQTEEFLSQFQEENPDISFVSLRYFNACGAALDSSIGEKHLPETHIIPLAIDSLLSNKEFYLFGTYYETPDGTCIRDYIHVLDLVEAHILAYEQIKKNKGGYFYNVGTGSGFSNREVIKMIEEVSGRKINLIEKERRKGDADRLIADSTKIKNELGFVPDYSDLKTIVKTAWEWHGKNIKY